MFMLFLLGRNCQWQSLTSTIYESFVVHSCITKQYVQCRTCRGLYFSAWWTRNCRRNKEKTLMSLNKLVRWLLNVKWRWCFLPSDGTVATGSSSHRRWYCNPPQNVNIASFFPIHLIPVQSVLIPVQSTSKPHLGNRISCVMSLIWVLSLRAVSCPHVLALPDQNERF